MTTDTPTGTTDLIRRLRDFAVHKPNLRPDYITAMLEAADALEAAEREADKWKQLDAEAATHVESAICMRSRHFTGEPPYVGWKGLGKALNEDYDDIAKAKAALEAAERVIAPFAEAAEGADGQHATDDLWQSPASTNLYVGQLRQAEHWLARHATGQRQGGNDDHE